MKELNRKKWIEIEEATAKEPEREFLNQHADECIALLKAWGILEDPTKDRIKITNALRDIIGTLEPTFKRFFRGNYFIILLYELIIVLRLSYENAAGFINMFLGDAAKPYTGANIEKHWRTMQQKVENFNGGDFPEVFTPWVTIHRLNQIPYIKALLYLYDNKESLVADELSLDDEREIMIEMYEDAEEYKDAALYRDTQLYEERLETERELEELLAYIAEIEDEKTAEIFEARFLKGMEWKEVNELVLGKYYNKSTAQKIVERYIEKKPFIDWD